ncbi:MAG: hypothetical protein MSB10_02630 [Clostridiales bacterium]|uniref:hypothetical protein n=1 Tax=Flavonifractor porci TaxID=3133422 RepID=UPI0030AA04BD|nr:hypothetical protein [Clostridiales bacterium]
MKRRTMCVVAAMLVCLVALAGCSGGDGLVGNIYTYDHVSIELPEGYEVDESGSFPIIYCPDYPERTDNINILKSGADSIGNYDADRIDNYYSTSFNGYNGMRSFEKTKVDGVDAIICSYDVDLNGVEMVGTQYYLFGKNFTDVITFTSVSGDYDNDFEDIAQSIAVH